MLIMNRQELMRQIEDLIEKNLSQKTIIVKDERVELLSFLEDDSEISVDTDFSIKELSREISEHVIDAFLSKYIYKYQTQFGMNGAWIKTSDGRIVEDNLLKGMPIIIPD